MAYPSLTKCFLEALDRLASPRAQLHRVEGGWQPISSAEMLRRVAGLSQALAALGAKPGDRVGLLSANRPEWHIADFAILGLGAADVPIYFNESPDRMAYILSDSAARFAIVVGEEQARALAACRSRLPVLEHVILARAPEEAAGDALRYESLIAAAGDSEVAEYRRRASAVVPGQLATIIYTSGTTGEPKGVMLTHENLSSNALDSVQSHDFTPRDLALSFLPLSHVFERMADYAYLFRGVPVAYVERIEQVQQALLEVHPTIAAAVPRVFEKMYANILDKGRRETGVKRRIFDWSLRVAVQSAPWRIYGKEAPPALKLSWHLANRLVYSKIRAGVGGRIRAFVSGAAPLAPELTEFFWSVGIPIYQGYGLTETSPAVTANLPGANKTGTVGRPIPNVEVRIAADGEILVHGPCVMQGYYHKPEQTEEAFTPDGWFCTGDVGHLDPEGYLLITDRKKELIKTAAGKFVAPQLIENKLKSSPLISSAMAVGDKRKFVSVLIVPNFAALHLKALEAGKTLATPGEFVADSWVLELIGEEVERLSASLAQYERPKRFALLDEDFSAANGQLTITLKLKRRVIEERYRGVIDGLYADLAEPRPPHEA
jgi:long-chain acyl-CoA synthetase